MILLWWCLYNSDLYMNYQSKIKEGQRNSKIFHRRRRYARQRFCNMFWDVWKPLILRRMLPQPLERSTYCFFSLFLILLWWSLYNSDLYMNYQSKVKEPQRSSKKFKEVLWPSSTVRSPKVLQHILGCMDTFQPPRDEVTGFRTVDLLIFWHFFDFALVMLI